MGILNRLWSKVWNDEETKKYRLMHDEIYAFTERAKERKQAALARARSLWPERTWRAGDDGVADAALIAWTWGRS